MSIAQRKDGRYLVKYKVNGQWKQKSFKSAQEAQEFDLDNKVEEATQERMSLGEVMTSYIRSRNMHKKSVSLAVNLICGRKNRRTGEHIEGAGEFLRDRYPETLTRKDLERLRENLRADNYTNASINRQVAMIRGCLSWSVNEGLIPCHPWRDFKKLPERRACNWTITIDQFRAVYEALPEWLQWAAKTAYSLCLRPGIVELFSLKWSAFNFTRNLVTMQQGKSGIYKTVIPPLQYMEEAHERMDKDMEQGISLVCHKNGNPITSYKHYWTKACDKVGVTMRFYDIRHLAATQMLASGADLAAVSAQLGHTSVATTGKTYAHVTSGSQRKAAQALVM